MKGYEVGDSIHGHRIIAEARRVSDPAVIVKSARHRAQRIVLTENALAIIDRKGDGAGKARDFNFIFCPLPDLNHILPLPSATTPLAMKSRFVVCPEATNAARGGIP